MILIKNYSYFAFIINIMAIILNILPYIGLDTLKTTSTIIFLITMAINLGLIYLDLSFLIKKRSIGQKIKKICKGYLIFFLFAAILIMLNSLIYSFVDAESLLRFFSFIGLQIAYNGIYGLGILISFYNLQNINHLEIWK